MLEVKRKSPPDIVVKVVNRVVFLDRGMFDDPVYFFPQFIRNVQIFILISVTDAKTQDFRVRTEMVPFLYRSKLLFKVLVKIYP